jgi:ankyrin repeat protein
MDHPEPDEDDVEAIIDAAWEGDLEKVRRLVQQDRRLLDADNGEQTPLTAAAVWGYVDVVRYLLGEGAQVNFRVRVHDDWSALHRRAPHAGRIEIVSLLLAHGADTAAATHHGYTPLMRAWDRGIVALLLAHGCGDIDSRCRGLARTALHHACGRDRAAEVVRALLGAGADPHVEDDEEHRPVWLALGRVSRELLSETLSKACSSDNPRI